MEIAEALSIVKTATRELLDEDTEIPDTYPLIGGDAEIDSMKLVELCLALEDAADDLGFEFDWTSDATMSRSRSMFRSVSTLAEEFLKQSKNT